MRLLTFSIVFANALAIAVKTQGDDTWDYPSGRHGVNNVSAGRAGEIRVFECETTDSVESVVLWYAKRLGASDDDRLSASAIKGFGALKKGRIFSYGFGYDTDNRKDHTQLIAHVTPAHAHVTFVHLPDFTQSSSVTISIAETPTGTSVQVIQPSGTTTNDDSSQATSG